MPGAVIEAPAVRVGPWQFMTSGSLIRSSPGRSRPMKRRQLLTGLAATALASGCTSQAPRRAQPHPPRYASPVPLPPPTTTGTISLEKAIGKRRSLRAFRPEPLPTATLGQLLWAGQGVTNPDGKRAAPSAGALYPLE